MLPSFPMQVEQVLSELDERAVRLPWLYKRQPYFAPVRLRPLYNGAVQHVRERPWHGNVNRERILASTAHILPEALVKAASAVACQSAFLFKTTPRYLNVSTKATGRPSTSKENLSGRPEHV